MTSGVFPRHSRGKIHDHFLTAEQLPEFALRQKSRSKYPRLFVLGYRAFLQPMDKYSRHRRFHIVIGNPGSIDGSTEPQR